MVVKRTLFASLSVTAVLGTCLFTAQPVFSDAVKLKDQMRMPWIPGDQFPYIHRWLICGEFPVTPPSATSTSIPLGTGVDKDYLASFGGEANVAPKAGLVVTSDGYTAAWKEYVVKEDAVDLIKIYGGGVHNFRVAYAYTTVDSAEDKDMTLALGSDDAVKVWVNGKQVHRLIAGRGVTLDEDAVRVHLNKGQNRLLIKVENGGGGWGYCARMIEGANRVAAAIRPSIDTSEAPNKILVRGNCSSDSLAIPTIEVTAIGAGGREADKQTIAASGEAAFTPASWPDGAYEFRCTVRMPNGKVTYNHFPWYKGDTLFAARRLMDSAKTADTRTEKGMLNAMLSDMIRDRLPNIDTLISLNESQVSSIHSPLMEWEEICLSDLPADPLASISAPIHDAQARALGFARMAWRDPVDDSVQFCRTYLPEGYTPAKKWPLVVILHGYNGDNPEYVRWWSVDSRHSANTEKYPVIQIEPHGRGNTWYQGMGDLDVMRCIQQAKTRFPIDENRIYLMGYSMGGGGTWYVGTRHPDVFAAIAPIYGGWDYHVDMSEEDYAKLDIKGRYFAEADSSFAQADAMLNTPIFVNHGDADPTVPVDYSRYAVRMLQRWGYNMRYWEHPGGGHGGFSCEDEILTFFLGHQLNTSPSNVRVRSQSIKYATDQWLKVNECSDQFAFINAKANIVAPNIITVDSDNATSITLSPTGPLIDQDKPVTVVWNGKEQEPVKMVDGSVTCNLPTYNREKSDKNPLINGPINDLTTTPYAIVPGTVATDPMLRAFCNRMAENVVSDWKRWQHTMPRVIKDTEITDEDVAKYSLVILGGPEANALAKRLMPELPLSYTPSAITIGGHEFKAKDAAIQVIYPNPRNPERYVAVYASNSPAGMYNHNYAPDNADYNIVDSNGEYPLIATGRFDEKWHYKDPFNIPGDEKKRSKCLCRTIPIYTAAAAAPGSDVYLDEVLDINATGSGSIMSRGIAVDGKPIKLDGKTYKHGLSMWMDFDGGSAEFNLADGKFIRLKGNTGLLVTSKLTDNQKASAVFHLLVKGDGKVLYDKPFQWNTRPEEIDLNITGVNTLSLSVNEENTRGYRGSINWADIRVTR